MTINWYCKCVREKILKLSLMDVADNNQLVYEILSAFEDEKNDTFANIYHYFNKLTNKEHQKLFKKHIWRLMGGDTDDVHI